MNSAQQRALVTGAAGFLGGIVARQLAAQGHSVRAIVRAHNMQSPAVSALRAVGVEIMPGDICDRAVIAEALRGRSHVYHLAAQKTLRGLRAAGYFAVNVAATRQLAETAVAEGVTRFVYASTLGVHGFVVGGIVDETSPVRPNTAYRRSKWLGEEALRELHKQRGLPVVIARVSTAVGPGARNWLPLMQAVQDEKIRLIGKGARNIDLVDAEDLATGLVQCASVQQATGQCYVLGSAAPTTIRAFANEIAIALGKPFPSDGPPVAPYRMAMHLLALVYRATGVHLNAAHAREVLVANKVANSALARAEIGYDPSRSVRTAIHAMVAHAVADGELTFVRS